MINDQKSKRGKLCMPTNNYNSVVDSCILKWRTYFPTKKLYSTKPITLLYIQKRRQIHHDDIILLKVLPTSSTYIRCTRAIILFYGNRKKEYDTTYFILQRVFSNHTWHTFGLPDRPSKSNVSNKERGRGDLSNYELVLSIL